MQYISCSDSKIFVLKKKTKKQYLSNIVTLYQAQVQDIFPYYFSGILLLYYFLLKLHQFTTLCLIQRCRLTPLHMFITTHPPPRLP